MLTSCRRGTLDSVTGAATFTSGATQQFRANGDTVFPLQNLPLGVFTPPGGDDQGPRGGIAIGDRILDLRAVAGLDLFDGDAGAAVLAAAGSTLNPLLALGSVPRRALRAAVFALLSEGTETGNAARRKAGELLQGVDGPVNCYGVTGEALAVELGAKAGKLLNRAPDVAGVVQVGV